MNKGVDYIISKMREYSKIPSLTYHEQDMLAYLEQDIPTKHYDLDKSNPQCLLYRYKGKTKYLVLAHIDRIEVEEFRFRRHNGRLTGQLDNVISVATCRYLIEQGTPVDFLFTTQEECLQSADQIAWAYEQCGNDYFVMDMDIDVALNEKEVMRGVISLRDKDNLAPYCNEVVKEMRRICDENEIAYSTKDDDWLVCQIGTAIDAVPKIKGMYLGLPIGNYHSHTEYVLTSCISKMVKLFRCIKKEYNGST